MEDAGLAITAPLLGVADLRALEQSLKALEQGKLNAQGFYPRIYPVRGTIQFATGWSWNNR
jgi:hypothetical protein